MRIYRQELNNEGQIFLKILKAGRMPLVIKIKGKSYYVSERRESLCILGVDGPMIIRPEVANSIYIKTSYSGAGDKFWEEE